jgi:hypothetical protein
MIGRRPERFEARAKCSSNFFIFQQESSNVRTPSEGTLELELSSEAVGWLSAQQHDGLPSLFPCSPKALRSCKERIELVAAALGLEGFARIDAFVHADTGEVRLHLPFRTPHSDFTMFHSTSP